MCNKTVNNMLMRSAIICTGALMLALPSIGGCGSQPSGITVTLTGCPEAAVMAGDVVTLVATVTDAAGNDITATSVLAASVAGAVFQITAVIDGNSIELPIPPTAALQTITANVTAQAAGSMGSAEPCSIMIEPLDCPTGEACDDEDPCTENDTCVVGVCVGTPVLCPPGQSCDDGECVPDDACDGVICDEGEVCVDGECISDDGCDGVMCDVGESCVDGECVPDDPCDGVMCNDGETCVEGECVAEDACDTPGNATVGAAYYTANGCAGCHGSDGSNGFAPNIVGASCELIFDNLTGADPHPVTIDDITQEDAANLAAFLEAM